MTSATRIADNVPIRTWVSIDMYLKSKLPKTGPRFHDPLMVVKKSDKGAILFVCMMAMKKWSI